MFHPDDIDAVRSARADAIHSDTSYSVDYRIVRPDGDIRYLRERGEVARDGDGAAIKLSGVVQDVTDLHAAQSALAERESFYKELIEQLGRAHVCTPVTNAHLVCRLLIEKTKSQA